jgi:hypothetical protein
MNQPNQEGYGRSAGVLAGYALLVGVFHALFAGFLVATGRRRDKQLPLRIAMTDVFLLGTATYKISRVIAKDSVTSFIRAPFTVYRGPSGSSEVKEDVRGSGVQKSIGELITCPFCVGTWIAALLTYGLVLESRVARAIAVMFTVAAVSDALQYGFEALRKSAEESEPQEQGSNDAAPSSAEA